MVTTRRSKRKNRSIKQPSGTNCKKCNRNFIRLIQHLDGSPACKSHYETLEESTLNSSLLRRSSRNRNIENANESNRDIDENTIDNDTLNGESNLGPEIEYTIDNTDLLSIQNDDTYMNSAQSNMSNTNNDQGVNIGLVNQLESHIGNDNGSMHSNDDIIHDPYLSNSIENDVTSSSYQETSSNESKSPYDFSNIFDTLYSSRKTISFSQKQLVSLKLFEILHKSQAPMSLYKEIQDFMENSIPILMNIEKPYIISRSDLLNQMHKDIVFRGLNRKVPHSRTKRKYNNNDEINGTRIVNSLQSGNAQGQIEVDGDNNSSSTHRNAVVVNPQQNNIISKLEVIYQNQQLLQLNNTSLSFSMKATKSNIQLEGCEGTFPVTTFCLISSIVGLLQNPILMSESNTIYHHSLYNDPNNNALNPLDIYNDIHTSDWFKKTYTQVIHNNENSVEGSFVKPKKVLCPIIFFIDGVAVDSYGRMSLEPVSYTLGIFKRIVRNLPIAWRVLGYIPNTEKAYHIRYPSNKTGANLKKKHYQQILHHILQQMSVLQKKGGFIWKLPYYKEEIEVSSGKSIRTIEYRKINLVFETMVVIGDAPGNDQLCGRKKNYVPTKSMNTGACRDCCVTYRDCDDYKYKCKFLTREFICNVPPKVREQLSFYDVGLIAFDSLSFGYNKLGINSSTPPELLHVWYLGVVQFLIEYFLDRMTTKAKALLNKAVCNLAQNYSRQSDRFMPKISTFTSGVDKCKLTGKEKGYQLFIIYIVMTSSLFKEQIIAIDQSAQRRFKVHTITNSDGTKKRKKIFLNKVIDTHDKYNKWLRIFEKMISIGEWMSATNVILKNVLNDTIEVRLWSDTGVDNCNLSEDQTHMHTSNNTNEELSGVNQQEDEEEEDTIEVNEDNTTNGIFFQSPDTVHHTLHDSRVNILVETDDDVRYANNEIDEVIEHEEYNIEQSLPNDYLNDEDEDSTSYHIGGRLKRQSFAISKVEYGIRLFMKEVRNVVSKEDRVRLKTVKFHQLLHFPHYIKMFGSPANIDGSRPEAIGKETAKYPGRHTQHRSDTMNFQAGCRYFENTTIDLSFCIACSTGQFDNNRQNNWNTEYFTKSYVNKLKYKGQEESTIYSDNQTRSSTTEIDTHTVDRMSYNTDQNVVPSGSTVLDYSYLRDNNRPNQRNRNNYISLKEINVLKNNCLPANSTKSILSSYEKSYYKQIVKYFFDEKFLQKTMNAKGKIEVLSSLKINNTIFRGCLAFYGDKQWFDWIDVIWELSDEDEGVQVLPAKIVAFINGKRFMIDNGLLNETSFNSRYPKSEYWAIIQSAKKADGANVHVSKMSTHYSMEDTLQCIPIESIKDTAFVVPDNVLDDKRNNTTSFNSNTSKFEILESGTFVSFKSTNQWANIFLDFDEGSLGT